MVQRGLAIAVASVLIVLVSVAGTAHGAVSTSPAGASRTINVAVPNDPSNWDMDFVQGDLVGLSLAKSVDAFLFDHPPLRTQHGYYILNTRKLAGIYAQSYTISDHGLLWTIKLKRGLKFPDGHAVTAQDFLWSKERGLAQKANLNFVYGLLGISKATQIKVVNPYTLQMRFSQYTPLQPYLQVISSWLSDPAIVKSHTTASDPWANGWMAKNPGQGGPYSVSEVVPGQRITLVRNPRWPGKVVNDKVVVRIVPSDADRILLLKKGDVDLAYGLTTREALSLKGSSGIKVLSIPTTDQVYLVMNFDKAPFNNLNFRRALAYAIPYSQIVKDIYSGNAVQDKSVLPKGMPGYSSKYWTYDTNLTKARQALAASRVQNPTIQLTIQSGVTEHEQIALLVQDALSKIGINVQIQKLDATTFSDQQSKHALAFTVTEGLAWINDPQYLFSLELVPSGYLNYGNYRNSQVVQIVNRSAKMLDSKKRTSAYLKAQQLAAQDLPWIPLAQPNYVVAMRQTLNGFLYANDQLYRFYTLTKK